jgi:hypothetical protein
MALTSTFSRFAAAGVSVAFLLLSLLLISVGLRVPTVSG